MPRDYSRARRIEDQLQRLLVDLIRREVKDPRVGAVTVTAVQVSPDLSHATVFVMPFAGHGDASEMLAGLRRASGFLRRELGHELKLRHTPDLAFKLDETIERGTALSQLIDRARASDADRQPATDDDADPRE